MKRKLRIIFLGTPVFAVASLKALIENKFNVVAVVTTPDKPAGRGMQLQQSPVKQYAVSQNISVLQPERLKNPDFVKELAAFNADIQVVIAFRMLPEIIWNMPPLGTMNLHASLLPDYRGAAPINWVLINGEKKTGVTTFFLKHEIDTGDILLQKEIPIDQTDNAGTLHDKLMLEGADLVVKSLVAIENGGYKTAPQNLTKALHNAPKIFKETCEIDWNQRSEEIVNLVRGLSPYPVARTKWKGQIMKIFEAKHVVSSSTTTHSIEQNAEPEFRTDGKTFMHVKTADGFVELLDVQLEGKKRMKVAEFLKGVR
jgi:methionyl-tRNA formyltransferase